MRIVFALAMGLLVGLVLAATILFYNPLSQYDGSSPVGESFFYDNDMEHFSVSHAGHLPVPFRPRDIEPLWESAIDGVVLTVFPLNNAEGEPVALASRVSVLSEDTDLLLHGVKTQNDWLLSFAGRGTLFVDDREDLSALVRYGVVPVWLLRQSWSGPRELLATSGPDAGSAQILGGTGEYENAKGRLRQSHLVKQFGRDGLGWSSQLGLELHTDNDDSEPVVTQR